VIYLIRPPAFIACEDDAHAARYEQDGYERVEAWRFVYWWSIRDYQDYARLRAADLNDWLLRQDLPAPGGRVAGWQPSGVLARVRRHRW